MGEQGAEIGAKSSQSTLQSRMLSRYWTFFPTLCNGCTNLMYSIVPRVDRIPDVFYLSRIYYFSIYTYIHN